MMNHFTRDELRNFAAKHNARRGRNKIDTINNLIDAGCVETVIGGFITGGFLR